MRPGFISRLAAGDHGEVGRGKRFLSEKGGCGTSRTNTTFSPGFPFTDLALYSHPDRHLQDGPGYYLRPARYPGQGKPTLWTLIPIYLLLRQQSLLKADLHAFPLLQSQPTTSPRIPPVSPDPWPALPLPKWPLLPEMGSTARPPGHPRRDQCLR